MITPFQFVRVLADTTTTAIDPTWDTLLEVAVPVGEIGNVLVDFRAAIYCLYTAPSSTYFGADVRLLWDGEPLPDAAYIEFDPAITSPNVDSYTDCLTLRSVIPNVAPGAHTLTVQWGVLTTDQIATIYANTANLVVEGKS